jgi:eukaryotic-like serine/threonine-protein kinase
VSHDEGGKKPAEKPWIGRLLANRYRLIARLGEGKMAEVYLARHVLIDRLSAIKVLRPEMGGDRALRRNFLREAKAVNRINHPNIVEISDYGETDETAYLVMEYVPGESLARHLGRAPLGWARAARVALQLGQALARAHEMGVVHRDVQPRNILLVPGRGGDDLVKLTDFGVAKLLDPSGDPRPATGRYVAHDLEPAYMAPELRLAGTADARVDLFSLGVVTYEATTGVLPFGSEVPQGPPPPLSERSVNVPEEFEELLRSLLGSTPEERPRDAFEVVGRLQRVLEIDRPSVELDPPTERTPHHRVNVPIASLATVPFDRIGPMSASLREQLFGAIEASPGLVAPTELQRLQELFEMVERLHALVTEDAERLGRLETRARTARAELGARIDELALERSRVLGWASTAAARGDSVRSRRLSGVLSIGTMDALLWEEATLEHEESSSLDNASELGREIEALTRELEEENERLEREGLSLQAQLEGHVAALRALAGEAWQNVHSIAHRLHVDLELADPRNPS